MRFYQYFPDLAKAGLQVEVQPLFDDASLSARYTAGQYGLKVVAQSFASRFACLWQRKKFDVLWIEKEALPWWPVCLESSLLVGLPYVLDFDDAVFHNYDLHRFGWVRYFYGKRLDRLMAGAALVVGGNEYLASRARAAGASWVEVLPTVIDLDRYAVKPISKIYADSLLRIVWIGSPSTACYLEMLREPLQALSLRVPFVLRVIGATVDWPGVNFECVQWTQDTEVASLAECTVGVMPLQDSAWERGKCGYKLIQYMSCSLPVVASPVGVNTEIVEDGTNGFCAATGTDWVVALERLLTDAELRSRMGRVGRLHVEAKYCLQVTGPRMVELLNKSALRSV
jgi:glycosyltransferase involved in cell wall biosynthesis